MDSNQLLGRYKQNIRQQRRQNRRDRRAARRGGDTSTFGGNDVNGGDQLQYAGGSPNFNENTGQPFGYMPDRFKRPDGDQMNYAGGTPGFYDKGGPGFGGNNGLTRPMPGFEGGSNTQNPFGSDKGYMDRVKQYDNFEDFRASLTPEERAYDDKQNNQKISIRGFGGGSPTASNMMAPEPEGNTRNPGPAYNRRVRGQSNNPNASEGGQGGGQSGQGQGGQGGGQYTNPGSGYMNFQNIMEQMYGYKPSPDDDEGRAMKNAFGYDMMSKFFDSMLSRGMGQYQSGLSKDMMNHAFTLEQLGLSNSRKEEFGYGMRAMDKQYELQNLFANQQYGRDLGQLAATGEQTRKNYEAMGVQNRLQTMTEGEQNRLGYAAQGDQARRGYRELGKQERLTLGDKNDYAKEQIRLSGRQQRLGYETLGDQERKTMGDEDKYTRGQMELGSSLKRDEMGDANKYAKEQLRVTGRQERLNIGARGEQERLNIGKRGDESRKSYEFEDRIDARQEQRERSRSRAQARAF